MTSYLIENEAENLKIGDVHLVQVPNFGIGYLEDIGSIEVSDG